MSENLKISSPVTQDTSNQEECSNKKSNQSSEHFVFNDPLPWENGSSTEHQNEDLPATECDPVPVIIVKEILFKFWSSFLFLNFSIFLFIIILLSSTRNPCKSISLLLLL